jgi:hypothetical protein
MTEVLLITRFQGSVEVFFKTLSQITYKNFGNLVDKSVSYLGVACI